MSGLAIGISILTLVNFFHPPPTSPIRSILRTFQTKESILLRLFSDFHKVGSLWTWTQTEEDEKSTSC